MNQPISRRDLVRLLGGAAAAGAVLPFPAHAAAWAPADRKKVNMIVRSEHPLDLEMPLDGFLEEWTPVERFFTRSHHYPAKVDLATWKLDVSGTVSKPLKLDLETLQKMPKVLMPAVLECAGNGRGLFEPSMPGLQWEYGAVANAKWAGVRLADVLKLAGVEEKSVEVLFDGADVPIGTMPEFKRSIPIGKAMDPDTILAYEMNGEPIPSLHGFPLRLIVPGWAGDCWVKWLTSIEVRREAFTGFFMATAYRHPERAMKPGSAADPAWMKPVTRLSVKSVIATPVDGAEVEVGKPMWVRGVTWTGGDTRVTALDLTFNGGMTWVQPQPGMFANQYAWRSWQYTHTPLEEGYLRMGCRATDGSGGIQPFVQSWNPSGYLYNAVQMIGVNVVKEVKAQPAAPAPPEHVTLPPHVRSNCIGCHQEDVITQQRLSKAQWTKEVEKMGAWGSKYKASEKEAIVDYLAKEFPYKKR
ncbi:MAG TPA: molybdopterin-dependent oxidoreductase [Bryobacteraceae bacterium]|jgi:DMSO/TMAO reductase YedYZ molybdopterin-dependent catalytic subunit